MVVLVSSPLFLPLFLFFNLLFVLAFVPSSLFLHFLVHFGPLCTWAVVAASFEPWTTAPFEPWVRVFEPWAKVAVFAMATAASCSCCSILASLPLRVSPCLAPLRKKKFHKKQSSVKGANLSGWSTCLWPCRGVSISSVNFTVCTPVLSTKFLYFTFFCHSASREDTKSNSCFQGRHSYTHTYIGQFHSSTKHVCSHLRAHVTQ